MLGVSKWPAAALSSMESAAQQTCGGDCPSKAQKGFLWVSEKRAASSSMMCFQASVSGTGHAKRTSFALWANLTGLLRRASFSKPSRIAWMKPSQ